jgi:hypothetical protein
VPYVLSADHTALAERTVISAWKSSNSRAASGLNDNGQIAGSGSFNNGTVARDRGFILTRDDGTTSSFQSITITPSAVASGQRATCTVLLTSPAPAGGARVELDTLYWFFVTIPDYVTVPAGVKQVTFPISVFGGDGTSVSVTAEHNGITRTATLIAGKS